MKRLKLQHGYHDALIRAVRYRDCDVILDIDLCRCANPSAGPATLFLTDVRNFDESRAALERARQENAERTYIDEIIGIVRHDEGGYLLDLMTAGGIHVEARGLFEA